MCMVEEVKYADGRVGCVVFVQSGQEAAMAWSIIVGLGRCGRVDRRFRWQYEVEVVGSI